MKKLTFILSMKKSSPFFFLVALLAACSSEPGAVKKTPAPIRSMEELMTSLTPGTGYYKINPSEEILIKAEKGTLIYVPADAFVCADGTAPGKEISLEVKECYSLSDMIGQGLSATSDSLVLQTGGMIHLRAFSDKKELQVKDGKAIVLGFPKGNSNDTMDLFYAVEDGKGNTTWKPDYNMYKIEAEKKAAPATESDAGIKYDYPVEMTEDLYDHRLAICYFTSVLYEIKLKDRPEKLFEYVESPNALPAEMLREFSQKEWRVHLEFDISKNGKMSNFRTEDETYTKYTPGALAAFRDLLAKAPALDLASAKDPLDLEWHFSLGVYGAKVLNEGRFREKFRNKFAEYKNKAIQQLDAKALDHYLLASTKLGWINCDRFWNTPEEKTDLLVKVKDPRNAKVQLVFEDINSIMQGEQKGDSLLFKNIPLGRSIKVIAISYHEGKPTLSVTKTKVSKAALELNAFKEFSLDELDAELSRQ